MNHLLLSRRLLLAVVLFAGITLGVAVERPNIVLIVADDLGWTDLACYGSDLHETPNLDRLAKEGVRFTDAYSASPVCTPTRASLMTGKHPARLNMTIWREAALDRGNRSLLQPVTLDSLPLEEITLAEILQGGGYYTAHIGKWHLGGAASYPQPHGFDVNIGGTQWGAPQSFFFPYRGDQYFRDWRYVPDLEPGREGDYLTDRLTDKAIEIMDQENGKRPFFINLWYHSVHTPIEGKPGVVAKYSEKIERLKPKNHLNPSYAAMVESLDENVGRVLQALETRGIADTTLILFYSDNGGFINGSRLQNGQAVTNNAPLRSGKGSCYEGGIRVPLIVKWPGRFPSGQVCSEPVYSCDLQPTIVRLAGLEAAENNPMDGMDISGLFITPGQDLERELLFFHYPHYYPTTTPVSAVRYKSWKLLHYYEDGRKELYNLEDDLGETSNVAGIWPDVVRYLSGQLDHWLESVDGKLPEKNPAK